MSIVREIDAWYEEFSTLTDGSPVPYILFKPIERFFAVEVTAIGDTRRSWLLPDGTTVQEAATGATERLPPHCVCGDEIPDGARFCVTCGRNVKP